MTTNSKESKKELFEIHQQALSHFPHASPVPRISSRFSAERGEKILHQQFQNVKVYPWQGVFEFPNVERVMAYYTSTAYFQKALSEPSNRQRLYDLVNEKIQNIIDKKGIFTLTHSGAIFLAQKTKSSYS